MKIAYLAQPYPPMISGAAIFAGQLAEGMARHGHKILVIAASDHGNPYLAQSGNLSVLRLRSMKNPMRVGQRMLLSGRSAAFRALEDFEPDLIHTHDVFQLGLAGITYARRAGIPIILSIHAVPGFAVSYLPGIAYLRTWVESLLWNYASWFLRQFSACVASTRTISNLVTCRTDIHPLVISDGFNPGIFTASPLPRDKEWEIRRRFGLPPMVPILLHVGRLDADKQVDRVIYAAAQTMNETDAHLLVIGDGNRRSSLMRLCQTLGIKDRVHFPGYIKVEQGLPDIYHLGTLFVTACEVETQGIVLLEAAGSGLPIVAVRATSIPEIVHDGRNGSLSMPGDITGMAHAMTTLVKDAGLAARMGIVSHQLSQAHHQERSMDLYEDLYKDVILGNKASAHGKVKKPAGSLRENRPVSGSGTG